MSRATKPVLVTNQHHSYNAKVHPAAEVRPGGEVVFDARREAWERMAAGKPLGADPWPAYNILTGPVAVHNAHAGSLLRVEVLEIEITHAWGFVHPEHGPIQQFANKQDVRELPIDNGLIAISDRLRMPLRPMIGSIGLAPFEGGTSALSAAKQTGGNMDLAQIRPGTTLWLPIEVEGALLSLGDLHAAMGEGEGLEVAIEAAGRVHVRLGIDDAAYFGIAIREGNRLMYVGERRKLFREAFLHLVEVMGLTAFEAHTYLAGYGHLRQPGPGSPGGYLLELDLEPLLGITTPSADPLQLRRGETEIIPMARPARPRKKKKVVSSEQQTLF